MSILSILLGAIAGGFVATVIETLHRRRFIAHMNVQLEEIREASTDYGEARYRDGYKDALVHNKPVPANPPTPDFSKEGPVERADFIYTIESKELWNVFFADAFSPVMKTYVRKAPAIPRLSDKRNEG